MKTVQLIIWNEILRTLSYIGIFKTYGYGCEINYEQAVNWFERAASLDDIRVLEDAKNAAAELRQLLEHASDVNERTLDYYQALNIEK